MLDFSGQRILVAGGSSGIGLATAELAAELGADVTIASRSRERVEAACRSCAHGLRGAVLDLADDAAVARFFALDEPWHHIVVTGSQVSMAAVRDLPLSSALDAVDSKFWGFYHVARHARIHSGGSLGVVAGFLSTRPAAGRALMGAINAALESLVRGLALELKPVRVNAVSPAVVDTSMWDSMEPSVREAMFERLRASYPAGCVGQPLDIARQLLLLAATPYATGTIVTLDGGASIA
ncbi:NAD(P)-dependent dehydrogenase (short-subunit alcohol dehydrogenase family) [Comamonas sp. BIGb0124]|uniref:SDR family oxidoreductase n=1 Tax=Comamonas sp. BIGb0124 TaxID=2485130 RepID=UPI000F49B9A7|nr:SDR family oxidoreductase [Comamonas sp. BIGb0124]ROR20157.1 NAD(P)-dependent dehydrogenase (short-subunit alcohol dehydrogenase family) [Comamonas sp. BIGb0124]